MKYAPKLTAVTLIVISSLALVTAMNTTRELCSGIFPKNDMKIPVGFKSLAGTPTGLSEAEFNTILDRADRIYGPVIAKAGGTLKINRLWTDATVNASAEEKGRTWYLNMYGGMARHELMTMEAFSTVVCHELGHHLGGAPKVQSWFGMMDWATNEGGADYFATLKCLRDFYLEDDNASIVAGATNDGKLNALAAKTCDQEFATDIDRQLCKRSSLGSQTLIAVLQTLKKPGAPPSTVPPADLATPDTNKVSETDDEHPKAQCRLDTYFAGATCNIDKTVALSNTDYRQGSCVENVAKLGYRPRCWFAP